MIIDSYLVGILYGDGWAYKRSDGSYVTCIDQVQKNKRIILEEVIPRFRRLGYRVSPYVYFAKHDGMYKWRALVYSKTLCQETKRIFADIVSYFEQLSMEDARQFIAGFFDAEGSIIIRRLILYNSNITLLNSIKRVVGGLGIQPIYIYKYNVVFGLTISRKPLIKRFVEEIPALKFKMYHDKLASFL